MQIRPLAPHEHEAFHATAARAGIVSPSTEFYLSHPANTGYVVEEGGEIIGTGVAIRHGGDTGWLAMITVAPEHQGRGIGRAVVEWGEEELRRQGVRSILLLASERGRPLYEKMGYQVGLRYDSYQGVGDESPAIPPAVRPLQAADWEAVCAMDRGVTGEERSWAIRALGGGYAVGEVGRPTGFYLPAPWGGGPAVARDPETGRGWIDLARRVRGGQPLVLRIPSVNGEAIAYLERCGLTYRSSTTRMVKGDWPAPYQPEQVWGMFSFGLG